MMIRSYSELSQFTTFEERFEYLKLEGHIGSETFGRDRWMNQEFYRSTAWLNARRATILRDEGCDLGIPGREINKDLLVHHINPMTSSDIIHSEPWIIDPEFLITTCIDTHNAIHFGGEPKAVSFIERRPGDTKLW